MQNKVTVISVIRNLIKGGRVEYFKKMIDSVKMQTYKNIEHVVVDGMSDDETWEFINKYKDDNKLNFVSYRQKDKNPYDAMNQAIYKYGGEYIVILHSDDYLYDENAIEMQMKYLEMTDSDYVTGDTVFIDKNDNRIVPYLGIAHRYDPTYFFLRGDNTAVFWSETSFNHEGMLMKKKCFEAVGYFSDAEFYGTSTDFKFEVDLILKDLKHVHIPYNFLCFRIGGCSSTHDSRFYNILEYIYSKFYFKKVTDITEYDKLRQNPDDLFIFGLRNYLLSLKLKNFDYKRCFDFLNLVKETQHQKCIIDLPKRESYQKRYRILGIPFIKKIVNDDRSIVYKLFWHLTLLRICVDSKGRNIYKLFGKMPIFKVYLDYHE